MNALKMHLFCTNFALFLHWLFVYNSRNMEYSFTKERLAHFRKMSFDDLSKLTFKDFTVTELKCLIAETPMKDEMKRASVAFYIKRGTYQEVADELHCSIDTAKRHRKRIRCLMLQTIINMFFNSEDCEED